MGINWNTVPAFYNDSYTYMEWLGKVTAKVEDHETRLTQAEADIDELQDDVAGIKLTLADHEQRIGKNEDDIADIKQDISDIKQDIRDINDNIDILESTVDTLSDWYTDHAADAVAWVEDMYTDVNNALSTTIPALQDQTAENTAAIISMQREGGVIYEDVTANCTSSTSAARVSITIPYERMTPAENALDISAQFDLKYNGDNYKFNVRQFSHGLGGVLYKSFGYPSAINVSDEAYIQGTLGNNGSGTLTLSIARFNLNGSDVTISDVTVDSIASVDILLYRAKTVTPTSEKEAYQASVQIFTDKTIPLDSRTASIIMQYYSAASVDPSITWATWAADYNTAHPGGLQLDTSSFPDTNKDGVINAIDASNILTYYSNASAGRTQYEHSDADAFYNWYLDGNPPHWEY